MSAVAQLIAGGVVAFKISAFESSPTRFPRIGADQVLDLFEALAPTDIPLGIHNEDQEIVRARMARARAAGRNDIAAHAVSRPLAAEQASTAHFLELGAVAGAHAHIVHLTSSRGFHLVETYKRDGFRATGELCVHYLWFDPETDAALGARMKVNPPIRPGQIEGLWQDVVAGRVAFVSSDHSSWPIENKFTTSIFDAGAGVPGLETLLPAFYTGAAQRGLDAARLTAEQLSERPAASSACGRRRAPWSPAPMPISPSCRPPRPCGTRPRRMTRSTGAPSTAAGSTQASCAAMSTAGSPGTARRSSTPPAMDIMCRAEPRAGSTEENKACR
jgi:allantoinase